jgi:hypothetical protein
MEAVYFEQQSRRSGRSDTKMVLYYACANIDCGFRWTDYSDNKQKPQVPQDEENIPDGYTEDENYMSDIYATQGLDNTFQGIKKKKFFQYSLQVYNIVFFFSLLFITTKKVLFN